MTSRAIDALWAGAWEPEELTELETDSLLAIDRASSLLAALDRMTRGPAELVMVAADDIEGREHDAVAALRAAGARSVMLVFRGANAHRAARAAGYGADAALALPALPGDFATAVHALLGSPSDQGEARASSEGAETDASATGSPDASPESPAPSGSGGDSLATLVGDAALVHRAVGDLDRLLDQVLVMFRRRSSATRSSLLLVDTQRDELVMQRAEGLADREAWTPIPLGEGIAGRVAATGQALLASNAAALEAAGADARGGYRTDSCLVLPLTATEGVVGVMCLADRADGRPFEPADHRTLTYLADQAGQALENSLKLRHMQDLAVIDELTGLYNRRYFQGALAREVQRARRYDRSLTVAIMDLDRFKQFNDLCGHPAGDRALSTVGEILRGALREVDIVARHGGEEFAVILPETSANETSGTKDPFPFLERLRRQVEETAIEGEEKLPGGKLTISIGVACFPDDATSAEDLFQTADDALYTSKEHGRNCVSYRGSRIEV